MAAEADLSWPYLPTPAICIAPSRYLIVHQLLRAHTDYIHFTVEATVSVMEAVVATVVEVT